MNIDKGRFAQAKNDFYTVLNNIMAISHVSAYNIRKIDEKDDSMPRLSR